MKLANANKAREKVVKQIQAYLVECGEDCGLITSNSFNFPIVIDGDEGWVEVVVKIPKEDEGYEKREEYQMKCKEREEKKKANAIAKAKKIERDKKVREQKRKEREGNNFPLPQKKERNKINVV